MKKKLIKVAILFLGVMICLTILSRVADSIIIAKVTTTRPSKAEIRRSIVSQGYVKATEEVVINVPVSIRVGGVFVEIGQQVQEGDTLFEFDAAALAEQALLVEQEVAKIDLEIEATKSRISVEQSERNSTQYQAQQGYEATVSEENLKVYQAAEMLTAAEYEYEQYINHPEQFGEDVTEKSLQSTVDEMQRMYDLAVSARNTAIGAAEQSLISADIPVPIDNSVETLEIDRGIKSAELEKLRNIQEQSGKIYATNPGIITEINVKSGSLSSEIEAAVLIANVQAGLKIVAQVECELAEDIFVGDVVSIKADPSKELTIQALQPNIEDPHILDIIIRVESDKVSVGSTTEISIDKKSKIYDICVPLTALHQEGDRFYVFVVEREESVLGSDTVAKRIPVSLLEKNDTTAAISGELLNIEEEIITESNKMINEGSRVRLEQP